MSHDPAPEVFAHRTDLSLDATGSFMLHATDEYFAPADRLLLPGPPEWHDGEYTARGKWMDGWESMRRRAPGHDAAIVRLGTPGRIEGVLCDTTHFKGNAPLEISLEALELPGTTPVADLLALPVVRDAAEAAARGGRAWVTVLPRVPVQPDTRNVIEIEPVLGRATHVRLRIFPDGGVARLRVYGTVVPAPDTFWGPDSVDLAAIEHGGTVAAASDAFFGPPAQMLLPGRGVNMGEGWETKRRRTPGTDWCVVKLGRRGLVQRIEMDTHFFKGNAPVSTRLECLDAGALSAAELASRLPATSGWDVLLDETPVGPHQRHIMVPCFERTATHVRVHIRPHGGVHRLRLVGVALDTPGEALALRALNSLEGEARDAVLRSFCAAPAFVGSLASQLPVPNVRELFAAAARSLSAMREGDWLQAFAAHPKLGQAPAPADASTPSAEWSRSEQSAMTGSEEEILERLRAGNEAYASKFGFVFLAFASGQSAAGILASLEDRMEHDRATELGIASREQVRITRRRIGRWLEDHGAR